MHKINKPRLLQKKVFFQKTVFEDSLFLFMGLPFNSLQTFPVPISTKDEDIFENI
jgi:hypothetical protein